MIYFWNSGLQDQCLGRGFGSRSSMSWAHFLLLNLVRRVFTLHTEPGRICVRLVYIPLPNTTLDGHEKSLFLLSLVTVYRIEGPKITPHAGRSYHTPEACFPTQSSNKGLLQDGASLPSDGHSRCAHVNNTGKS